MATITKSLYNRFVAGDPPGPGPSDNRLLANVLGGVQSAFFGSSNKGDTLAISIYFLDDMGGGSIPFKNHRYATSLVEIRVRASGNNTVYAYGNNNFVGSEIAPASGLPSVIRTQSGAGAEEKQRIIFPSPPQTGSFKLGYGGGGIAGGGVGPQGYSGAINVADGAAGIEAALRAMPLVKWINDPPTPVQGSWSQFIFATGDLSGLGTLIEYQRGAPTGGPGIVPLPTFNVGFDVQYAFGHTVSVALTASNYTDAFLQSNGPVYLEALLDGTIVAQLQLVSDVVPGQPPTAEFTADVLSGIPGTTINFHDASTNAPTSWAWSFGDTSSGAANASTAQSPSHTYAAAGVYTVQLTATNANGSNTITKTNLVNIGSSPPPPPPSGGPVSTAGIIYDGNYHNLLACGICRIDRKIEARADSLIYRQPFQQFLADYDQPAVGSGGCPINSFARFVQDEGMQDMGGGIVQFTRVWALVPSSWTEQVSATKQFQSLQLILNGSNVVDFNIVSWSDAINCACHHYYFLGVNAPFHPTVPKIQIVPFLLSGKQVIDNGTGFPLNNPQKAGWFGSNYGVLTNISTSIEPYMGDIWEQRIIQGGQ